MTYPTFRLDDRVAIVTGAAQGIGRSLALGLANAGATVVATGRSLERLREVEQALRELGRPAIALAMDVRHPDAVEKAVSRVVESYGRLDVMVNNAAVRVSKPALEHTLEDWESLFQVNSTGVFVCSQAAARAMRESGGGSIINVSSIMAHAVEPNRLAYCASKAAVIQMTRVMALEWASYGIRVNVLAPGPTRTPFIMAAVAAGAMAPTFLDRVPMGRIGEPDEMIGACVYLASDAGSFVTGSVVTVDGGRSLRWR